MTLSPSTLRLDLKCGKGAISKGEKCTKGASTQASLQENILKYGGVAGAIGSLAYATRPKANVFAAASAFNASVGAVASGIALEGQRTKNRAKQGIATSVAAASLGSAALNAYAAHSFGKFNQQYTQNRESFNRGQREVNETFNNAWANAGGRSGQSTNSSSWNQNASRTRRNTAVANPYSDLGVSERASDADIKKQWLNLMRRNHPDAGGSADQAKRINAAYQEILRRRGRRDSVWAAGFVLDLDQVAV